MRIESLEHYKYFFQLIKEEPLRLKRYSLLLILIPLVTFCFLNNWDLQILLFILLGYLSASIGFLAAHSSRNTASVSFQKHFFHELIAEGLDDITILINNRDQKILYVNPAFYEVLGFVPSRIPNVCFDDFMDSNTSRLLKKRMHFVKHQMNSFSVQPVSGATEIIPIKKRNKDTIWVEVNAKKIGENEIYSLLRFTEVTKKVEFEKATNQFAKDLVLKRTLFNNLTSKKQKPVLN